MYGFVPLIWPSNWSQISQTPICHHTLQSHWSRFETEFLQVSCSSDHLLSCTGFDQLKLNFNRTFLQIQPFDHDQNFLELSFHYTFWNKSLNFKSKDGAWWTYVVCLYGVVFLICPSICSRISPTRICHHTLQYEWSRFDNEFHNV